MLRVELRDGFLYVTWNGSTFNLPYESTKFLDNDPAMLGAHFEFKAESPEVEVLYLEGYELARRDASIISLGADTLRTALV